MIVEFLPGPDQGLMGFLSLYLCLVLLHISVHFSFSGLVLLGNRYHPWRKIQVSHTRIPVLTEIGQSWSGFVGTPLCLATGLWSQHQGWTLTPVATGIWSLLLFFVLATLLHDIWFYWAHRLLHTKALIRWHRLHHLSPVPTVWSNDRFTLPDVLLTQSFLGLLPFVVPIPPLALVLYRLSDHLKGIVGHSGYEWAAGRYAVWPMPFVCVLHHDSHHELFRYNFGNTLSVWDRLFGTLDPDYDARVLSLRARLVKRPET